MTKPQTYKCNSPFGEREYHTYGSMPAQEALDEIARLAELAGGGKDVTMLGERLKHNSLRYHTFRKGLKCVSCDRVGTVMLLQRSKGSNPDTERCHFNLYAADGMLMTKDHVFPKSKGGKDVIENMQTMCQDCNHAKGATI